MDKKTHILYWRSCTCLVHPASNLNNNFFKKIYQRGGKLVILLYRSIKYPI